jgi:RNA polymerase sigma-70 factor (ECF subfamily)
MERVVYSEATDRELVAQCQAGEEAAFDELVRRHRARAFHIAYPLLANHEDATEVAQDAFVRVYRNIGEFRGDAEFTTWLYQIVVNLARNKRRWWKRRGRQATVSLDDPIEGQVAAAADAPDVAAAKAEFVRTLSTKMAELPEKFREVLLLRNVEGMSYEQIAVMLNCSVGTVKSRIARARDQLREAMSEERM